MFETILLICLGLTIILVIVQDRKIDMQYAQLEAYEEILAVHIHVLSQHGVVINFDGEEVEDEPDN